MEEKNGDWMQRVLLSELILGMETAKSLKLDLTTESSLESKDFQVSKIISSFEKLLSIVDGEGTGGTPAQAPDIAAAFSESPGSLNGSPRKADLDGTGKEFTTSKKRKAMDRRTEHVRVSSENGLEGSYNDGFSWRKYGQKLILGFKHPRSYYRCTYKDTQSCCATKQVQRSNDDPTVFEITKKGEHTCSHWRHESPEKEKQKLIHGFIGTQNLQQPDGPLENTNIPFSVSYNAQFMVPRGCYSPVKPMSYTLPSLTNLDLQNLSSSVEIMSCNTSGGNSSVFDPLAEPGCSYAGTDSGQNFPFEGYLC